MKVWVGMLNKEVFLEILSHVHGRWWRGSWICSSCFPRLPRVSPRPLRTPAWHHWPPWNRTYFSGAPPNCCRRRLRQSCACIHLSCASRTPGNACRSEWRQQTNMIFCTCQKTAARAGGASGISLGPMCFSWHIFGICFHGSDQGNLMFSQTRGGPCTCSLHHTSELT